MRGCLRLQARMPQLGYENDVQREDEVAQDQSSSLAAMRCIHNSLS